MLQLGLHLNSQGEFVLDGQVAIPLSPAEQVAGVTWDIAFETVLTRVASRSNTLVILWKDEGGKVMSTTYSLNQPFSIDFAHDQWVRRIEHSGGGNIIVAVEKAAMPIRGAASANDFSGPVGASPEVPNPQSFVETYFAAVWQDRDYSVLWETYLTPRFQSSSSPGGLTEYSRWWDSVSRVELHDVDVTAWQGTKSTVSVLVSFHMLDGDVLRRRTYDYDLTFNAAANTWMFDIH